MSLKTHPLSTIFTHICRYADYMQISEVTLSHNTRKANQKTICSLEIHKHRLVQVQCAVSTEVLSKDRENRRN